MPCPGPYHVHMNLSLKFKYLSSLLSALITLMFKPFSLAALILHLIILELRLSPQIMSSSLLGGNFLFHENFCITDIFDLTDEWSAVSILISPVLVQVSTVFLGTLTNLEISPAWPSFTWICYGDTIVNNAVSLMTHDCMADLYVLVSLYLLKLCPLTVLSKWRSLCTHAQMVSLGLDSPKRSFTASALISYILCLRILSSTQ